MTLNSNWKPASIIYFKILSQFINGGTENNCNSVLKGIKRPGQAPGVPGG
jgi:hypothetical protein